MSDERDLAPILEYLQGIGWEELYAPTKAVRGTPGAQGQAVPKPMERRPVREARPDFAPDTGSPAGRPVSGWAAVRARLQGEGAAAATATSPEPSPATATGASVAAAVSPVDDADVASFAESLAALATEALACTRCRLAGGRKSVVFGTGDANADLMFIGEGPGAEEDRQGLPFVGPAGQLLDRIIGAIGLTRQQVYICNVVKCRPPGNRDPQPDEVAACRGFLESQVRLVRPRVIVALGRVAAQTLLGSDLSVGRMRGTWHEVLGVPVRVTYHPAAILRDGSYRRPTWDDMQLVRDRLAGR